jgi:hypothetical protein
VNIEIARFYEQRNIPIPLLIDKRRKGLSPEQVEEAATEVYKEIQGGLSMEARDIPRYVFSKAHDLKGKEYKKKQLQIFNYDKKFIRLVEAYKKNKAELTRLQTSFEKKRIRWMKLIFWSMWPIAIIYVVLKLIELGCLNEIFRL